jgi:Zn-finger nucleic acid-binding protein
MWFDLGELDEFLRRFTEKKRRLDPSFASKRIQRFTIEGPEGYLPCPRCGDLMNRSNYGRISGVLIDSCKPHGMWLDGGEADKIAVFIESGGLAEAERRKVEDLKRQASSAQAELDSARRARNRAWSIGPVIFWDVW